ncbi:MAG TPA: PP2C family protein-serine/threonine phosphatase [Candidatus Limnocylindrales bacterium]
MTAEIPGLALALVATDGSVVSASGDWPGGSLDGSGRMGTRTIELAVDDEPVGTLIVLGEAPPGLLVGIERSVALLIREALEKHHLARETLDRYRELNLLYRASATIGACLDAADLPRLVLSEAQHAIPFDAGAVLLPVSPGVADWQPAGTTGREDTIANLLAAAADLVDVARTTGRPDIAVWPDAPAGRPATAIGVPIRVGDDVLGVVVLGRLAGARAFTAGDEKLMLGLAGEAGIALERASMQERETRRLQLEEELAVARRIQLTLLPSAPPVIPGWRFAASYVAARQVGGDFYDFIVQAVPRQRLGLVIGDVTGKGVPAALMMAYTRAVLRAESMADRAPLEVLANTNRSMMEERRSRLFVSAFYAEIELDSGRLSYCNAGHDPPLWIAAGGRVRELENSGAILGAFRDAGLESRSVVLEPGESVVLYTDGLTEARNHQRELFGEERLRSAAGASVAAGGDAASTLEALEMAVAAFTAGAEQADDLTIVVIQREGSEPWNA